MQTCTKCKNSKSIANFRNDKKGKNGVRSQCKACEKDSRVVNLLQKKHFRPVDLTDAELLRKCTACNELKHATEFRKSKYLRKCKICAQKYERERRRVIRENREILTPVVHVSDDSMFTKAQTSMGGFFTVYNFRGSLDSFEDIGKNLNIFLTELISQIPIKISLEIDFTMKNAKGAEFNISKKTNKAKVTDNNIYKVTEKCLDEIKSIIFESHYEESGLTFVKISGIRVYVNPAIITTGGTFIQLPQRIQNTQACINIQNTKDNKCFLWCLIAHFHRLRNPKKETNPSKLFIYNKPALISEFNLKGIQFPVSLVDVPDIEKQNNLSINVYKLSEVLIETENGEKEVAYPISLIYPDNTEFSRPLIDDRHVNLLFYKGHYVLIVNMRRLFSSCVNGTHSAFVCEWCGTSIFTSKKSLDTHELKCKFKYDHQKYVIPQERSVRFTNYQNTIQSPFIIYADFESYFEKSEKPNTQKTSYEKVHRAMGYGFKTVCRSDPELGTEMNFFIGKNAENKFVFELSNEIRRIASIVQTTVSIRLTEADQEQFSAARECFICNKKFGDEQKVRDHDHISGKYRGASHNKCNLQYTKKNFKIPVVFHNLEGYDIHLFIDSLSRVGKDFEIIPKSKEKYLSMAMKFHDCKIKVKFIDSLHFFTGSLSDNAKTITKFRFIKDEFKELQFKQYYPYSYFDSLEKLEEPALPKDKAHWYNELKKESITDYELAHAEYVFQKYNCKNLHDYTALYLQTDVNLLAEVFENFRDLSIQTYQLDPALYYTTPGLAWDAALRKTEIELELLQDRDMIDFFIEKGTMRGGISTVSRKKESSANNKYMKSYDPTRESTFIMYYDVTNLYGFTMTGFLPTGGFKWLDLFDIHLIEQDITLLYPSIDSPVGYILEVDLIYPLELRDSHIELPMAPEHFDGKLSPNLFSKYNYRLRLENLKYYLDHGLRLHRIIKVLQFDQSKWLKQYIDTNTELRKKSSDESAKNFYKLMNNAVYGKTMENVFNRKNYKLVGKQNIDKVIKMTRSSDFKKEHLLTENLVILEMNKTEISFNKPIYIGFSILELSKLHMYRLHYDTIKSKFGSRAVLLYMDTDSLIYEIKSEDIYQEMSDIKHVFDMSVYPPDFPYYNSENKGVLGTLKDEFASTNRRLNGISEFSCLRSKCYSLSTYQLEEQKKCKGVIKAELKSLSHSDFTNCNANGGVIEITQTTFKTSNHDIYTVQTTKDGLSRFDNKRQIDGRMGDPPIYTIPWGYSKTTDEE
jgi:hypothetical protein